MTLNEWFRRKASLRLGVVGLLVGLVWVIYFIGVLNENAAREEEGVRQLANLLSLAAEQKNRILTESLLESTHTTLGADSAVICEGKAALVSSNAENSLCQGRLSTFLHPVVSYEIPGLRRTNLIVVFSSLRGKSQVWLLLIVGFLFSAFCFVILYALRNDILRDILQPIEKGMLGADPLAISELEELRKRRQEVEAARGQAAALAAVLENKSKVAHNIKSPLRTLRLLEEKISGLIPPRESKLLAGVIDSINKILSDQRTGGQPSSAVTPITERRAREGNRELLLFSDFLDETIAQKAAELGESARITVSSAGCAPVFVNVVKHELRAVLSNLINNSAEAMGEAGGRIKIVSGFRENSLAISVSDSGPGVPPSIREKIFEKDFTYGKKAGSGFGLYHARRYLAEWGGSIQYLAHEQGATFEIEIPLAQKPKWCAGEINAGQKKHILILDDDNLIHSEWRERFSALSDSGVRLHFAVNEAEFERCIAEIGPEIADALILCDYDLGGKKSGLEVIRSYGLTTITTMVTNSFNDQAVLTTCMELNLSVLPKPLIRSVLITA